MIKGCLFSILLLCQLTASGFEDIAGLLRLDKSIRSDSITTWYKIHVRQLDSANALTILNELEHKAGATGNMIGVVTAIFLKGQYLETRLKKHTDADRYTEKAINLASRNKLEYEWAVFTFQKGITCFFNDKISLAIECLLRADDKFRQIGYGNDKNAALHLYNIGYVYYHLHNYKESLKYLNEAARYPYNDTWVNRQLPNTTGLVYGKLGIYDSALTVFDKLLQTALLENDTLWAGIVSGNIGEVYIRQKAYDNALPYLEKSYNYIRQSDATGITGNILNALVSMADVYAAKGDRQKVQSLLAEANALWPKADPADYWRQAYLFEVMAKASALKNDYAGAYRNLQMSKIVDDSINRRDNALRYMYVQQQIESEKHQALLKLIAARQKVVTQRRRFVFAAFGMIAVIAWLSYNRYRLKVKKDIEIWDKKNQLLESEKLRMEEDLASARELLNQYVASINEKNDLIERFRDELSGKNHPPGLAIPSEERFEYLQQLSDASLLTDGQWDRFKELFCKVYKGFFADIKNRIPDITEAELRLIALLKLNISNKQMAHMLGISPSSVHTARYRLRKKMAGKEDRQLAELIG